MEDWTKWLTEVEQKALKNAIYALALAEEKHRSYPWVHRSPARAKTVVALLRSLAASRALVGEKARALREAKTLFDVAINRGAHWCSNESEAYDWVEGALALTEEEMLKRLERN